MIKLKIATILKHSELDNYSEGCDPETSQQSVIDIDFQNKDQDDLIKSVLDWFGAGSCEIDPCGDDPSRFDFSVLECAEGSPASDLEIYLWKQGKEKLYLCNYSCYVEIVKPFELVK